MNLVWSPHALARALDAVDYFKADHPLAADEWLSGLLDRVDLLLELPEQGRVVPEWVDPAIREIVYDPYRVIYEIFPDRVEIITLSHQRQDLDENGGW